MKPKTRKAEKMATGDETTIEKTTVEIMRITAPRLDPISVIFQDFGPGQGRVLIECYGKAWSAFWGAMGLFEDGPQTVRRFFLSCDASYLTGALMNGPAKKRDTEYLKQIVESVKAALLS